MIRVREQGEGTTGSDIRAAAVLTPNSSTPNPQPNPPHATPKITTPQLRTQPSKPPTQICAVAPNSAFWGCLIAGACPESPADSLEGYACAQTAAGAPPNCGGFLESAWGGLEGGGTPEGLK